VTSCARVYFDEPTGAAYYLGFDLVLVAAPVRDGRIETREAVPAEPDRARPETAARYAAIKAQLHEAAFGSDPRWTEDIARAHAEAEELATAAGLDGPVELDPDGVRIVDLG
jgi:uncharacterized protein YbjT (DUF2867 family)